MVLKKNGSIIFLVAITSFALFTLFLLYYQFTDSNRHDSAMFENFIQCKNKIFNAKSAIIKLFENDLTPEYDWKYDFWFSSPVIFSYSGVLITVYFTDEDAKINVNQLLYPDGKINSLNEKLIQNILDEKKITPEFSNIFMDWIDADHNLSHFGAEKESYNDTVLILPPNKPFSVHTEFALLKNLNNYFDIDMTSETTNLYNYFTIYGDNRYNINTVSPEILDAFNFLDKLEIAAIIDFRDKFPIKEIANLPSYIPELKKNNYELIDGYLKTATDILKIDIIAEFRGYKLKYVWIYDKSIKKTLYQKFCF